MSKNILIVLPVLGTIAILWKFWTTREWFYHLLKKGPRDYWFWKGVELIVLALILIAVFVYAIFDLLDVKS